MNKKHPKVEALINGEEEWRDEAKALRALALAAGLTEEVKWGKPCYSLNGHNVVLIQGFKAYCALFFCKGALLKDAKGLLQKPGVHTQATRQLRFTNAREILAQKATIAAYLREAIAAEKAGKEVVYKTTPEPVPDELEEKFSHSPSLKAAFYALTPGRQRGYLLFFSGAKQSETRTARIEKYESRIREGQGMHD
jgi:uncharacterized protein YdeI (YjbR/CyaY-like superfamily)